MKTNKTFAIVMFTFFGCKTVGYAHTAENAKSVAESLSAVTGCEHKVYIKCDEHRRPRIHRETPTPTRA